MHAISSYRGNKTPPARRKNTYRQDRLQYTVPLASAQCNQVTMNAAGCVACIDTLQKRVSESRSAFCCSCGRRVVPISSATANPTVGQHNEELLAYIYDDCIWRHYHRVLFAECCSISMHTTANGLNPSSDEAFVQDYVLPSECFLRTSINFTVSHFIIDIYFHHCFMCLYGCGLTTFIKLLSDLI